MHKKTEEALLLALLALVKGNTKPAREARKAILDALEKAGLRWPRSDDGRF